MTMLLAMIFSGIVGGIASWLYSIHLNAKENKESYDFGFRVGVAIGYFKGQESIEKKGMQNGEVEKKVKVNKCNACEDKFIWSDQVVNVDDNLYHKDCITLVPTGYFALIDNEPLGETENDDGQDATEFFPELLDDDEED